MREPSTDRARLGASGTVAILGAGAIGCGIASALVANGHMPVLVTDWAEHASAVNEVGLRMIGPDGATTSIPLRALSSRELAAEPPVGLAYLTVKCQGTARYVELLRRVLADDGAVVSMQNGVTVDELAEGLGRHRVIGGSPNFSAERPAPGIVRRMGTSSALVVGELDGRSTERVRAVARLTDGSGWRTVTSSNIIGVLWSKLIANSMVNALCVIGGWTVGELMSHPVARPVSVAMMLEAAAVADALCVRLEPLPTIDLPQAVFVARRDPVAGEEFHRAFGRVFPDARVSSLQDVEAGRGTELDHFTGRVVELGRRLGVATPVSAGVLSLARRVEDGSARSGEFVRDLPHLQEV